MQHAAHLLQDDLVLAVLEALDAALLPLVHQLAEQLRLGHVIWRRPPVLACAPNTHNCHDQLLRWELLAALAMDNGLSRLATIDLRLCLLVDKM